jgi:hypothetical protein
MLLFWKRGQPNKVRTDEGQTHLQPHLHGRYAVLLLAEAREDGGWFGSETESERSVGVRGKNEAFIEEGRRIGNLKADSPRLHCQISEMLRPCFSPSSQTALCYPANK